MPGSDTWAVLFDVDGTLVDTDYLHAVCWGEALRQNGHAVPMATVHRAIGMGTAELLDHLVGPDRDRDQDALLDSGHLTLYKQFWGRLQPLPDAGAGKPAADILLGALNSVDTAAERSVFVGDSVWDGQAAKKAGVLFIGLTCGGSSEAELLENGAVEVWRDPAQLLGNWTRSALSRLGQS